MPASLGAEGEDGEDGEADEEGMGRAGGARPGAADAAGPVPVLSDGVQEVLGSGRSSGVGQEEGADVLALLDWLAGKPVLEAALAGA